MLTFLVQTLGCKLNQLESEAVSDAFDQSGIKEGSGDDNPSFVVINTCTVTSKADQKARRVIRKTLRDYPDAAVIVTGCYAQLNKDDILKLETDNRQRLCVIEKDKIINFIKSIKTPCSPLPVTAFEFNPKQFSRHTRAFLKIQDGCDKHCTYCRIRLARGPNISLEAEEVLQRLRVLEQTHAEAVLTGVNICQYTDKKFFYREMSLTEEREKILNLAGLLEFLLNGTKKIAVRLSSLSPESVDEKLCAVLPHPRIRPHFHLSVQSCSDKILEKMGRAYNAETVQKAVELLRGAKGDPFLACDIITGFPGETEKEFEETFIMCKNLNFARIHVFPYSKRKGTPAFSFPGTVHENEVTERVRLFTSLAELGKTEYVKRWLGKEIDVLIEKQKKKDISYPIGVSENYLKALVMQNGKKALEPGDVVTCRIIEAGNMKDYDALTVLVHRVN